MRTEALTITKDMFDPSGGSRETQAMYARLLRRSFGPVGVDFMEGVRSGSIRASQRGEYRNEIDAHYFRFMKDKLRLPKHISPPMLFSNGGSTAIGVVTDLADFAGLTTANYPLASEISPNPNSPTDILYYLSLQGEKGQQLEFNARRHFLLSTTAQQIEANSGNGAVQSTLSDMQFYFNEHLYEGGEEGERVKHTSFSFHDIESNRFAKFLDNVYAPQDAEGRIIRNDYLSRRLTGSDQLVYLIDRKKDSVAATQKTIAKSYEHEGIIEPKDVEDVMGIKVVTLQRNIHLTSEQIAAQVQYVYQRYQNILITRPDFVRIDQDTRVNSGRGQSQEIDWQRGKVHLSSIPVPIEFIVVGEAEHIKQSYEVGELDEESGLYGGQAHGLFMVRRKRMVAETLLPAPFHDQNAINRGFRARSREVAQSLTNNKSVVRAISREGVPQYL